MVRLDPHLPLRWLADLEDGVLAPQRRAAAEAHRREGCGRCERRAAVVHRLIAAVAAGPLEEPPAALDRRVLETLTRALDRPFDETENVLMGHLVLDQHLECAGALRTAAADTRRLLWMVGDHEVDASLAAHSGGTDLLGQFMPPGDDPNATVVGHVEARSGRRIVARVPVAKDGRFTFRGLAPGAYVFAGVVDGRPFVLPRLVLE